MKKKKIINLLKTFMFFTLKTTKHCCEKLKVFYDFNVAPQLVIVVKNPPANAGDSREAGSIPGLGRSPGGGCSNLLQYSCLENSMDRGAWWATVHRVAKSQTQLKQLSTDDFIVTVFKFLFTYYLLLMYRNTVFFLYELCVLLPC